MNEAALHNLPGLVCSAKQVVARVVANNQLATDTYCVQLECPEIAQQIKPGQFFMIRAAGTTDPLLGRPFALFDVVQEAGTTTGLLFGHVVVGKLTSLMTTWQPDDEVVMWGPLGNGFPPPAEGHLMLVAGGIGQTPFLAVAREALGLQQYGLPPRKVETLPESVSLCYGARSRDYLAGIDMFDIAGLNLQIATDDGTVGHAGYVTELLEQSIQSDNPPTHVYTCGPVPMMHAAAALCAKHDIPCWLSLETPMACGFGACFSCVTRVKLHDGSWDYRRTCVEGPIFPAEELVF